MRHLFYTLILMHLLGHLVVGQHSERTSSPREMLEIMKIDESLLGQFVDERPVEGDEEEPLQRLLFRIPSFAQVDIDRWAKPMDERWSLEELCAQRRFEFIDIQGKIERIENVKIIPELISRLGFSNYFKITIAHNDIKSLVYVQQLPKRWTNALDRGADIQESIRVQGLLLKKQSIDNATGLVFATARIQWFPDTKSKALGVTDDEILLSEMGVDIGQLGEIQQRAAMTGSDRESFYQTLAAVHHSEITQFAKLGRREFDIARMIRTPEQVVSELYSLEGTARRAIRIEVDDVDIRERFGIHHYFEVEVFVPMAKAVRFVDEDQQARVFRDYPFVFCVPELPGNMPTGDDIRVPVQATGFFLKLWAYRTEFMSEVKTRDAKPAKQLSPLLIGPTIIPITAPPEESQLSQIMAVLFIASLAVIWLLLWRASIQDRRRARQLFQKNVPGDTSFKNLTG